MFNALDSFPIIQRKSLRYLYRICGQNKLFPLSIQIDLPYNGAVVPYCSGGFADVLRWEDPERTIAVKVLKTCPNSDLRRITRVSHLRPLSFHPGTRSP